MATLQWNEHIRVVVSEMSHKQYFAVSAALNEFIFAGKPEGIDAFGYWKAVVGRIIPYSRIEVYRDNVKLENGVHDIGGALLTLPLSADGLDELPASLAKFIIDATQSENQIVLRDFIQRTAGLTAMLSAPSSVSTPPDRSG